MPPRGLGPLDDDALQRRSRELHVVPARTRDLNAAINIERRGKIRCLGEVLPGARDTDEVMKGNPESRRQQAILRAEAPKSDLRQLP
jgi:hypothetical protein